jgi:hypothetical protein
MNNIDITVIKLKEDLDKLDFKGSLLEHQYFKKDLEKYGSL